jgi:transposase
VEEISRIGIDISRTVFQVHAASLDGAVVWRKRVHRSELLQLLREVPACEIGMEACGGANYWGREFEALGHRVKLIPPQYVKPFVKRNKNDAADAEAISEAMSRPTMRFVPVKSVAQQELGQLHRTRELLVRHRTALVNEIKGFLHEHWIVMSCGREKLRSQYLEKLERHGERMGEIVKRMMEHLFEQLQKTNAAIKEHEGEIKALHEGNEMSVRLASIPGVGVLTATAVIASVGDAKRFKNGREFAASLGVVPRQHSSGQTERLQGVSKRGNPYIRRLLVQGGQSVVTALPKAKGPRAEWLRGVLERRGRAKAVMAVANKNARIIWALMARGGSYASSHGKVDQVAEAA